MERTKNGLMITTFKIRTGSEFGPVTNVLLPCAGIRIIMSADLTRIILMAGIFMW